MDSITLKGFRCFRGEQTARLAPLTLLVGENSTGKTSFMAMVRALWDMAYGSRVPDFKEDPYDLGSFDEIAHHRGAKGGKVVEFEAGFESTSLRRKTGRGKAVAKGSYRFGVIFGRKGTVPVPVIRRLERNKYWVEERFLESQGRQVRFGTPKGSWQRQERSNLKNTPLNLSEPVIWPLHRSFAVYGRSPETAFSALGKSPPMTEKELDKLHRLAFEFHIGRPRYVYGEKNRPFASAPVRSRPSRTYDPARPAPDPEGAYVPTYLASVYFRDKSAWADLKGKLEAFGRASGLFDEILVKPLGRREAEPFQVQVRKFDGRFKGPRRNLIDVGYGVSQALPIITELLRQEAPSTFLLQQPEVHLHPSAQAALGSLFCHIASSRRRLVVETHSDHLLVRVRMDVRDGATRLKPDDVSILFFERRGLDVHIHSLRLDEHGNVLGQPEGYRRFFMEETQRSLGL